MREGGGVREGGTYIDNVGDVEHAFPLGLVLVGLHGVLGPETVVGLFKWSRGVKRVSVRRGSMRQWEGGREEEQRGVRGRENEEGGGRKEGRTYRFRCVALGRRAFDCGLQGFHLAFCCGVWEAGRC